MARQCVMSLLMNIIWTMDYDVTHKCRVADYNIETEHHFLGCIVYDMDL